MTTIPMEQFGKDHWSLLIYIESRAVDDERHYDRRHMRSDGKRYPTRLRDGRHVEGHDDLDCLADLAAAELIQEGPGDIAWPTDRGWQVVGQLRRRRSEGMAIGAFRPT